MDRRAILQEVRQGDERVSARQSACIAAAGATFERRMNMARMIEALQAVAGPDFEIVVRLRRREVPYVG